MKDYILILKESNRGTIVGVRYLEGVAIHDALSEAAEGELRQFNWSIMEIAKISTKKEVVHDGLIDELIED